MKYANRIWAYSYRKLFKICPEKNLVSTTNSILKEYTNLTKEWTKERNSEWSCRMYFAAKMILNATVLLNSLKFANTSGFRTANSYFEYYATLSLLRGLVCTIPTAQWNSGALISMPHSKTMNIAFDWIRKFNRPHALQMERISLQLKAQRELIAYKAPASGDNNFNFKYELIDFLTVIAEVTEFNSELLERSIDKHADPSSFQVLNEHIKQIAEIKIEGFSFFDKEDYSWLGYIQRKTRRPYHLGSFIHPGQAEDFMCAWDGDECARASFSNGSPCNWQSIFDVP
jgi:hypothetical protein